MLRLPRNLILNIILTGILLTCFPITGQAAIIEAEQQFKYADMLFEKKQYLKAAEEYQRFAFFFPNHPNRRAATFKSGESFLLAKNIDAALLAFKSLSTAEPLDKLATESFFKMAECYMLKNAPSHAVVQLNNLIMLSEDTAIKDRAYFVMGWVHIEQTDWSAAKSTFDRISPAGRKQYELNKLDKALVGAETIPTKDPVLSGTLSIVPGAGQLYCHRYEDAFFAFVVNVGLIWAAYDAFDNEQYGLGGLLSFVGFGFYTGNIYGAVNDAHKFNRLEKRKFIDQLRYYATPDHHRPQNDASTETMLFSFNIPF